MASADPFRRELFKALVGWRDGQAEAAKSRGEEMFLSNPDAWYEHPHWFCINGHVSGCFLKGDSGDRCLACGEAVIMGPPVKEADFAITLAGLINKVRGKPTPEAGESV